MNTQHSMEERLWEYIDGTSAAGEKQLIEDLLRQHAEWREKYRELLELSEALKSSELEEPSLRFSKNVMEEIAKLHIAPATKNYINNKIILGIGIFFISLLLAILVYGFSQMDWASAESNSISDKLGKIDVSKFFNNSLINVFMMINVLLGLVLVDHYLNNKRKHFRKVA
ncbi:MAG: hypothetical protein HYZ15_12830 [Sphingobacteriales bacterium]|nr:hypothetical protein [Sphingobacteriales bacterium]